MGLSRFTSRRVAPRRALVVLAVVATLAGCTSTAPGPDAATSVTPTAPATTPTPTPTVQAQPSPRLGLACDDLADAEMLELAFGRAVDPVDPVDAWFARTASMYPNYPVLQQGGLTCLWQNDDDPGATDYASAQIEILPDAADQWDSVFSDEPEATCSTGFCSIDALVDGTWVAIVLSGVPVDDDRSGVSAEVTGLVNNITGVVQAAGDPTDAPEPVPAPEGAECASLIDAAVVQQATGIEIELATLNAADGPQGGMSFTADGEPLVTQCVVTSAGIEGPEVLTVSILPDAEWAMRAAIAHSSPAGSSVVEAVDGVPDGDAAQRCESVHSAQITCYLDLLDEGTWVQLALTSAMETPEGTEIEADPIEALTAIAASVVQQLR